MELIATIEKDISQKERIVVKDGTTWGTPARNTYNLVLLMDRFHSDSYKTIDPEKVAPNGSSLTLTEWVVTEVKDGYYKVLVVAALSHDPLLAYQKDKVVYGTVDGKAGLFISLDDNVPAGTPLDDTYFWDRMESANDFPIMANTGAERVLIDHLHDFSARICIAEQGIEVAKNDCDCPDKAKKKYYFKALLFHHASVYSGAFGEFEESGKFLDQAMDHCGSASAELNDDCGC